VPLPAPNLDDRRFQTLVDEAKRMVQRRCPEWTDHNVSDPGVTLIETFAYMTDLLLYRLNRVPDRNYVHFLEMIGVRLFPPTAARAPVTFWLSAPQELDVLVPEGTIVSTRRVERGDEPVSFTTVEDLNIVAAVLQNIVSIDHAGMDRDHTKRIGVAPFYAFTAQPVANDTLLIGMSEAVPSCAVLLRFDCSIEGVGVDPTDPPLVWEAWSGEDWQRCEVDRDGTGGLNRPGDVVIHVPRSHSVSVIQEVRAGWLRVRLIDPKENQPSYSASPSINALQAFVIGGTVEAENARAVQHEIIGVSDGVAGQVFDLEYKPVVPSRKPVVLQVGGEQGWQEWTEVENFADSGPEDRHFVLDRVMGQVVLGPAVRLREGGLQHFGQVPPKGAALRVIEYHSGGGRRGNVARHAISTLRSSIPFVTNVENRHPASGGVDGEEVGDAKVRGPITLRTLGRAVTPEDYEELSRQASPEIARVRCVPASSPEEAGVVRVLVVPAVEGEEWRLKFQELVPNEKTLRRIAEFLEARRTIGARVVVEPPAYQGVTVVAKIRAEAGVDSNRLEEVAATALYHFLHPIEGGAEGKGWPFGRAVHVGEVYACLQRVKGVELVESARLYAADPITGERSQALQRVEIGNNTLVFSFEHQIKAEAASAS
jgi:predicted phage baseplate assembly protein